MHHITLATAGENDHDDHDGSTNAAATSEWARVLASTDVERHRLVVPMVPMWFDDDLKAPRHVAERLLHHHEPVVRDESRNSIVRKYRVKFT